MINILSPDGFPISMEPFETKEEALTFFGDWKKGFKNQGYYSSNNGRIPLEDLENHCEFQSAEEYA